MNRYFKVFGLGFLRFHAPVAFFWVVFATPACVHAQYAFTTNNDGTLTIIRYTGTDIGVTIPSEIDGLKVTGIGDAAFYGCNVTNITLPDGLAVIGNRAFSSTSLARLTIPNSVTSLGTNVFSSCWGLITVALGQGISSIPTGAFEDCRALTSFIIPSNVTTIGDDAFFYCYNLTTVFLPNTLEAIGARAFASCDLTGLTIPAAVTSIGPDIVSGCPHFYGISVDANNLYYTGVDGVLFDKPETTLISYPEGRSGPYSIPGGVTNVTPDAFSSCFGLTSITIPGSVVSLGNTPFSECYRLTIINVDANNAFYLSIDGVLFSKDASSLIAFPGGKAGNYSIPNTVRSISVGAFQTCVGITNILIPPSVTNIADNAFYNSTIENVVLPDSVVSLGTNAFWFCSRLASVTIGNGVRSVGDGTFNSCSSLVSVTIPDSVTNIGTGAFESCYSLGNVTIGNGVVLIGSVAFANCNALSRVNLGVSVRSIGYEGFAGCTSLTNVALPSGLNEIGSGAFAACKNLTEIKIPDSVMNIGDKAFFYCTSLTNVSIGDSVTNIGDSAFSQCNSLATVVVGSSVTSIRDYVFSGGVTPITPTFYFKGNAPAVDSNVFQYAIDPPIYYLPGTAGWGPTLAGHPTFLWSLPYPLILNHTLAVQTNQFGFIVSWATNRSVVVEASTDLGNPLWTPLQTNAMTASSTDGWFYFRDPQAANYPSRFYRIRSP